MDYINNSYNFLCDFTCIYTLSELKNRLVVLLHIDDDKSYLHSILRKRIDNCRSKHELKSVFNQIIKLTK